MHLPPLVLASTSIYRRTLLQRLELAFECVAPNVDEGETDAEAPALRAHRLALAKARAVAALRPEAAIIGADQVAVCEDQVLHKPGTIAQCHAQLAAQSAKSVQFHTAVAVLYPPAAFVDTFTELTVVQFRPLTSAEIERYVAAEQPLDCAGAFKSEGLGASLFERVHSEDPSGLIGLPLIRLARSLRALGYALP